MSRMLGAFLIGIGLVGLFLLPLGLVTHVGVLVVEGIVEIAIGFAGALLALRSA